MRGEATPEGETQAKFQAETAVAIDPAGAGRRALRANTPGSEVRAIARWIRVSPRKARRAIDLIRGKPVAEARSILVFLNLGAAGTILKVLDSAVANAEHNNGWNRKEMRVVKAFVDGGPTLKRFQPHAQGRAFPIKKRTSHITVVVGK